MARIVKLIATLLAGAALPIVMVILARAWSPIAVDVEDEVSLLQVALAKPLQQEATVPNAKDSVLYIRTDLEDLLLTALRSQYPSLKLQPWRSRPADHGCESSDPNLIVMAPCGRGDYVSVHLKSLPLWHVAIVSIGQFNSGGEMILVKFSGSWHIVSHRWFVI